MGKDLALANGKPRGIRQRLGLNTKRAKICKGRLSNNLASSLVALYSKGRLSAGDVGDCSAAASSQFSDHSLKRLAKARSKVTRDANPAVEKDVKNSSRTLLRSLQAHAVLHPVYTAKVTQWDRKKLEKTTADMAFLPPHETLGALVQQGQEAEWCSLTGAQQGFQGDLEAWAAKVGVSLLDNFFACLALWGDAAPHTKRDSIYLLLFMVMSGVHRTRFWICAFSKKLTCKCGCFGRCTFNDVFQVISWSMRALMCGQYPACDHEGKLFDATSYRGRLAGKRLPVCGAMLSKCGDWDWFKHALGLVGWKGEGSSKRICWLCQAGFSDGHWCYDFSQTAAWRQTMVDDATFWEMAAHGPQFRSTIWSIPGFSIRFCRPDFMHSCCLGILQYMLGNIMFELFQSLGGTFLKHQHACGLLENIMKLAAKELQVPPPFNSLTLGMFRGAPSKRPRMKLKAAEGRYFLPVLLLMLSKMFGLGTSHEILRYQCADALNNVYLELKNWIPGGTSLQRLGHFGRQHLILYCELSKASTDSMVWNMFPKHHQFIHVVEEARENPKLEWNYPQEDEIGKAGGIAAKCNQSYLCTKVLARYRATFEWCRS
jgi:hypothetical protein